MKRRMRGTTEWVQNFVPGRSVTYPDLPYLPIWMNVLWASPPTPHTNRGSVRPLRLDTAHSKYASNGE